MELTRRFELTRMAAAADEHEFSGFCAAHQQSLVSALSLFLGDRFVAEEIAQDALAVAFRDWNKVRACENPEAWLYRVAFNRAKSFFRRKVAERSALRAADVASATEGVDLTLNVFVRDLIRGLPHRQRTALILRYYLDLSVADAAAAMGCSPGTVKALTHKAATKIRSSVSANEFEVTDG